MTNILDAFEDVYSLNVVKSFHTIFQKRFGKKLAINITRILTSSATKDNIFDQKVVPL